MRRLFLACCLLAVRAAGAEPALAPQVWVNPGIYSYHFDRDADFRENNAGLGAEALLAPAHVLLAGTFINSDRERTRYAAYAYRPLRWTPGGVGVSAGLIIGVFDGYPRMRDGGSFVGILPLLAIEGEHLGANLTLVPSLGDRLHGAVAFQIKLRVW